MGYFFLVISFTHIFPYEYSINISAILQLSTLKDTEIMPGNHPMYTQIQTDISAYAI